MHTTVESLFNGLWQDYIHITPSAERIHSLLKAKTNSNDIVNDHIALRTFNIDGIGLAVLAKHFLSLGYEQKGDYDFASKKLTAQHFEHPNPLVPKVFISELRVNELSAEAQSIIHNLVAQMDKTAVTNDDFLYSGAHWQASSTQYKTLLAESEYAAWMAAWGFRANHFTVSINHLGNIDELHTVNQILKDAGYTLNTAGGEIKGGEDVCLAQSSTMADSSDVQFSDASVAIPSCFYEFAQRYEQANGELYQGFVAASADKIFESTNVN
ncbi:MAG: DUF1338 domain-containing protein [Glaciecola sp.]